MFYSRIYDLLWCTYGFHLTYLQLSQNLQSMQLLGPFLAIGQSSLHLPSSYLLQMADDTQVFEVYNPEEPPRYVRGTNHASDELAERLSRAHECHSSFILPSGVASLSTAIQVSLEQQRIAAQKAWADKKTPVAEQTIHFLYGNELYSDTPKVIESWASQCAVEVTLTPIDVRDGAEFENHCSKLKGKISILLVESCSNPSSFIFHWNLLKRFKDWCRKAIVIVDNTWLTHLIFNPFKVGADMVVTSLSKYYSAGTKIGGAIMTTSTYHGHIQAYIKRCGYHVSPNDSTLLLSQWDSLESRLASSSQLTRLILEQTKSRFPNLLIDHVLHKPQLLETAKRFWSLKGDDLLYVPSVFAFWINTDKKTALDIMKKAPIPLETSFGGELSKLDNYPKQDPSTGLTQCRFATGYNDNSDSIVPAWLKFLESIKSLIPEAHKS